MRLIALRVKLRYGCAMLPVLKNIILTVAWQATNSIFTSYSLQSNLRFTNCLRAWLFQNQTGVFPGMIMQSRTNNIRIASSDLKTFIKSIDWKLLLFLILFLNIKMPAKIVAMVLIYALQFNFKFGFKLKNSRLPLFYLLIIPIALGGLIINRNYLNHNYSLVFLTGIGCWLLSLLAIHQIKLMIEKNDVETINKTIIAFFILNAVVSVANLLFIMWETKSIDPYTFRGMYQTYFINTGDNIKGLTFDISSTNAVLSALGMIYFLVKNNPVMLLICAITIFLTYNNLITLLLLFVLLLIFAFKSSGNQKSMVVICLGLYLVFMLKVSPQNSSYTTEAIQNTFHQAKPQPDFDTSLIVKPLVKKPDNLLTPEEKKRAIAIKYLDSVAGIAKQKQVSGLKQSALTIGQYRPNTRGIVKRTEQDYLSKAIEPDRQKMLDFISKHPASLPLSIHQDPFKALPGKVTGTIQTLTFLYHHPVAIVAGLGIGNFSSKIAYRAAGLSIRGRYPENYTYIDKDFLTNHLDLYMSFFSRRVGFRSVKNNPFSVYDQLLSEYGLTGLLALIIFYFGFFAKQYKVLTYGVPMILLMMSVFFIDYWFEQLSVIVTFELMLFLNIKEGETLPKKLELSHAN